MEKLIETCWEHNRGSPVPWFESDWPPWNWISDRACNRHGAAPPPFVQVTSQLVTDIYGDRGHVLDPKKRPRAQDDCGNHDRGIQNDMPDLCFDATDSRAKHRMVCEQLIHLLYTCEANSKRRRLSEPPSPGVQVLLAPSCDAGEAVRCKTGSSIQFAICEPGHRRPKNFTPSVYPARAYAPPPTYYDDGIDFEVGDHPPRFFIDDDAESALGEAASSQQAEIRKKLLKLAGITPEQISEMIKMIRAANKELCDLTPKEYIERSRRIAYDTLGKRYGAGACRELLGTVPKRPLLIRILQEETESSERQGDDVPTSGGGQASAEPHLPRLTIVFPATKSLEFRICTHENTPDLLFAWWFLGNGPFHCPWKINITASLLAAIEENTVVISSKTWSNLSELTEEKKLSLMKEGLASVVASAKGFLEYQSLTEEPITGLKLSSENKLCTTMTEVDASKLGLFEQEKDDNTIADPSECSELFRKVIQVHHAQQGRFPIFLPGPDGELHYSRDTVPHLPTTPELPSQVEAKATLEKVKQVIFECRREAAERQQTASGIAESLLLVGDAMHMDQRASAETEDFDPTKLYKLFGGTADLTNMLGQHPETLRTRRLREEAHLRCGHGQDPREIGYLPRYDNLGEILEAPSCDFLDFANGFDTRRFHWWDNKATSKNLDRLTALIQRFPTLAPCFHLRREADRRDDPYVWEVSLDKDDPAMIMLTHYGYTAEKHEGSRQEFRLPKSLFHIELV